MQIILLVEDDKIINREVSIGLRAGLSADVQVLSAYTIKEAYQMVKDFEIDLAIVDIEFPDGSGIDLVRDMRNKDEDMPIMIASSHTTEQLHMNLNNELDLFLVLKKPYQAIDILPRIKSNLRKVKNRQELFIEIKEARRRFKIPRNGVVKVETVKGSKRIELTLYNEKNGIVSLREFPMQSMEAFMSLLPESSNLVRIHQSTIVNPDFVFHYDGSVNELHLHHVEKALSIGKTYRKTVGVLFSRLK